MTERLRRAILDAEFELGQALSEEKLAAALGVSRTPVRDALTALQRQGLIDVQPQRGSFVFLPSEADAAELCEFREMMELRALASCCAVHRDGTLAQMRRACEEMDGAAARGDHRAVAQFDGEFHNALFDNCGNKYVVEAYKLASGQIAALRGHLRTRDVDRAMTEHRAILEALSRADLAAAQAILGDHIRKMLPAYVEALAGSRQGQRQPRGIPVLAD